MTQQKTHLRKPSEAARELAAKATARPWRDDAFWVTADDARYGYRERDAVLVVKVSDMETLIEQTEAALGEALALLRALTRRCTEPSDAHADAMEFLARQEAPDGK